MFTGEQVIKSKTENGFVPNGATGGGKSQDRTEPMMGAKVLLEMYLLRSIQERKKELSPCNGVHGAVTLFATRHAAPAQAGTCTS